MSSTLRVWRLRKKDARVVSALARPEGSLKDKFSAGILRILCVDAQNRYILEVKAVNLSVLLKKRIMGLLFEFLYWVLLSSPCTPPLIRQRARCLQALVSDQKLNACSVFSTSVTKVSVGRHCTRVSVTCSVFSNARPLRFREKDISRISC